MLDGEVGGTEDIFFLFHNCWYSDNNNIYLLKWGRRDTEVVPGIFGKQMSFKRKWIKLKASYFVFPAMN